MHDWIQNNVYFYEKSNKKFTEEGSVDQFNNTNLLITFTCDFVVTVEQQHGGLV